MKENKIELKRVLMDSLTEYPGNPRRNNKSSHIVAESIKKFGYISPITINEKNQILCGNTRYKAMKLLGATEIDVIVEHGLTPEEEHDFVIADNRVGEFSEWNQSAVDRMTFASDDKEYLESIGIINIKELKDRIMAMVEAEERRENEEK